MCNTVWMLQSDRATGEALECCGPLCIARGADMCADRDYDVRLYTFVDKDYWTNGTLREWYNNPKGD